MGPGGYRLSLVSRNAVSVLHTRKRVWYSVSGSVAANHGRRKGNQMKPSQVAIALTCMHTRVDPIQEAQAMVGNDRVLVVNHTSPELDD